MDYPKTYHGLSQVMTWIILVHVTGYKIRFADYLDSHHGLPYNPWIMVYNPL